MDQTRKRIGATRPPGGDVKEARSQEDSSFSLLRDNITEGLRILLLRRWTFFIPFCLIAGLAAIASHRIPRTYRSTTSFERRDHPVLMNLRRSAVTGGFATFFRPTLAQDLTSPEAMGEVVASLGMCGEVERGEDGSLSPADAARCEAIGAQYRSGVDVKLHSKDEYLDQIIVTYTGADPEIPQRLVNQIKNTYVRRTQERMLQLFHEIRAYFDNSAQEQRRRVESLDEELARFEAKYAGIDPTNPGALQLKLSDLANEASTLEREVETFRREIEARRRLLTSYRQQAAAAPAPTPAPMIDIPNIVRSKESLRIEREIRALQEEVHDLQVARGMKDAHPTIVESRKQIARLQEMLKQQYLADSKAQPEDQGLPHLDSNTAQAAVEAAFGHQAEIANIELEITDREGRLALLERRLNLTQAEIAKHEELQSHVFRYRKEYQLKADQLKQARGEYQQNMLRVTEIERVLNADESERGLSFTELVPPSSCVKPLSPSSRTVLALPLLAGLAAGAIAVLLKELFDQSYHTTKQVTRSLGLTVLESVDQIVTSVDRARMFRRKVLLAPAVVAVMLGFVGLTCALAYLSVENPRTYSRLMELPDEYIDEWNDARLQQADASESTESALQDRDASLDKSRDRDAQLPAPSTERNDETWPARLAGRGGGA